MAPHDRRGEGVGGSARRATLKHSLALMQQQLLFLKCAVSAVVALVEFVGVYVTNERAVEPKFIDVVLPQKSGPTLTMSFDKKEDCNAEEAPQA